MGSEQLKRVQSSNFTAPPVSVHVMVVDDDASSLALLSGLLTTLKYQVTSVNDPIRALYTLRARKQSFDLIITDLYMTKMDGFELTKRAEDEFNLPVIMISGDDRESVMFKAMQSGVVLYLLKPVTLNDLRNIWQFAISTKRRTKMNPDFCIEEGAETSSEDASSAFSSNEGRGEREKYLNKGKTWENEERENGKNRSSVTATKKAKVIWTDSLQYRFLQAVHYIGLDRAVPKKILEVMNVDGLTRENVASHLQKYRIFLKKVAERCLIASGKMTEEVLWSNFLSRHASLLSHHQNPNSPFFRHEKASTDKNDHHHPSNFCPSSFQTNLASGFGSSEAQDWKSSYGNDNPTFLGQNSSLMGSSNDTQLQNLANFENSSYSGQNSSCPSRNYVGFSMEFGGELSMMDGTGNCIHGSSNGCDYGSDFLNGNSLSIEPIEAGNSCCIQDNANFVQKDHNGLEIGGEKNYIWDSIYSDFNIADNGGVSNSSHALIDPNAQQQGTEDFMDDYNFMQLYNMHVADEETPPTSPFSIDDQVFEEFLKSLFKTETFTEELQLQISESCHDS